MDVKIIKVDGEYFATFLNFKQNIKFYSVKGSYEVGSPTIKSFHFNLNENDHDLFNNDLNIFSPYIKLETLNNVKHYYTITLYTDDMVSYPFYVDYNQLYGIEKEEDIYHYNFMKPIFNSSKEQMFKFYLRGIYGDLHQIDLVDIKNKNEAFFRLPKKELLTSEVYDIITELNGKRVFRGAFPVLPVDSVDFTISYYDMGDNLKVVVNPKFSTCTLDNIKISYNGRVLREVSREKLDLNRTLREACFYIPASGFNKDNVFRITYTASESSLSLNNSITKDTIVSFSEKRDNIDIYGFTQEYNFDNDSMFITWKNRSRSELIYRIDIGGQSFVTKDTSLTIENFVKMNNNQSVIEGTIRCSNLKSKVSDSEVSSKIFLTNHQFIHLSNPFDPVIDYSETIYCNRAYGKLKWSTPNFKHYAKVKISTVLNNRFLDEFAAPWVINYVLDEHVEEFDKRYADYSQDYTYNFSQGKEVKKSPNDSTIVYDIEIGQWKALENTNNINIPLWFNSPGSKYKVELELYDMFNKFVGSTNVEFEVRDSEIGSIAMENVRFNRKQFLQFGETGTVGEFFKIENPKPIDVRNSYSPEYKTFLGQPLTDSTNIDHDGNSLFFYLNTNEGDYAEIRYNRTFNFYSIQFTITKFGLPIHTVTHVPKGNEFEDNYIRIEKNKLKLEGEYRMKIQTFSSSGQASKIKEVSFFVHNEKPEKPFVRIKADDFIEDPNEEIPITINKKYFELEVTNNDLSQKYAGWRFKETHFFFRTLDVPFLQFADYVIQTNVSDGSIVMKNAVAIENGDYECKVINYDYAGNASEPHIFKFKLRSEIKITPHALFTNNPRASMNWQILKSQDSEGFYYFWRYSKDGQEYYDDPPVKYESPYFPGNGDSRAVTLTLPWKSDTNGFLEGYYQLVCYEYSRKHPEGQPQYEFVSPIVEVNEIANPSNPIYSQPFTGKVAVFNRGSSIEWSYAKDLNDLVFESLHVEMIEDNPDTPEVESTYYKLVIISPDKQNTNEVLIPQPEKVGNFTIDKIAEKAGISVQMEGVWELRFITIDKYGNTNETRGYYTYYVSLVKRNPVLNRVSLTNGNGTKYFGLYSDVIGFYIDCSELYKSLDGYDEHKEKFPITNCDVSFLENPFNTQYTITVIPDDKDTVSILSKLSENDKLSHSRDGRYNTLISARDPLGRMSQHVDRAFYIDTTTESDIFFVNYNTFVEKVVNLTAVASDKVRKVYYLTNDVNLPKPEDIREEILKWDNVPAEEITIGTNTYFGVSIPPIEYLTDGYKVLYYAIEEDSGNLGKIQAYSFRVDTTNRLIPQFDYNNKIHFSPGDEYVEIGWGNTNQAVVEFEVKLNKIAISPDGTIEITKYYAIQVDSVSTIIPVGPEEESYVSLGGEKRISIMMDKDSVLMTGQYMLTVKGLDIYGGTNENRFIFQIDYSTPVDVAASVINNKITIDHNIITWESVNYAEFYEVSYDGKSWTKTIDNKFFVNTDNVQSEANGVGYIYLRWKSKTGVYSETSKVILNISLTALSEPTVKFFTEDTITENNNMLKWDVIVEEPDKVKGIYYSFDKVNWHFKLVQGRVNTIINNTVVYPVPDGVYDIFVLLVDDDPTTNIRFNKSPMVHSYATVFASEIPTPVFSGLVNGTTLSNPHRLFIDNKEPNVRYYLYVNGKIVEEGYEISSSTYRKFNITCKAKKYGINKTFDLLSEDDYFHVWSLCNEPYVIDINNSQIVVSVDHANTNMIIEATPSLTSKQIILFKEKDNAESEWNIVKKGDVLTLLKEWEFRVSTITVL